MNSKFTLYDKIIDNIPLYCKKTLSVTGAIIFTAFVLYLLHATAISYTSTYFFEIGVPYFDQPINLWSFYTFNFTLLLVVIISVILFIGLYVIGWLGFMDPKAKNIYQYIFYSSMVGLVLFSFFLSVPKYRWWLYGISVLLFIVFMTIVQYRDNKNIDRPEPTKPNKLIMYFIFLVVIPYILFFPFMGLFIFNTYVASEFGKNESRTLLENINNNEYIDKRGSAIIKASGEYVYTLNCGSSCFIVRKNEENELFFEFIDSKDIVFLRN